MTDGISESGVLAGILQHHSEAFYDVSDILRVESFSEERNQIIWKVLTEFFNEKPNDSKIDIPSVYAAAKNLGLYDEIQKNKEYLGKLLKFKVERNNLRSLAQKIRRLEIVRQYDVRFLETRSDIQKLTGNEPISQIISAAENPILEVGQSLNDNQDGPVQIAAEAREVLSERIERPLTHNGIKTGFPIHDNITGGGLRKGGIGLFGARMKGAKSFLADNIALNIAKQNIHVLSIDTEMDRFNRCDRVLANLSEVETNKITSGVFGRNEHEIIKVYNAADYLGTLPYKYVRVVGMSFDQILSIIRRWVIKDVGVDEYGNTKDCVVVFDYFKLMDSTSIKNNVLETMALGFQFMQLHALLVKHAIAGAAFVQLNRDGIDNESSAVIAQSDRLAMYCDFFTIMKDLTEDETNGNREYKKKFVNILTRYGPGLPKENYINLKVDLRIGRIQEGPTRNDQAGLRTFQTTSEPVNF